jgi:hypothetical protein
VHVAWSRPTSPLLGLAAAGESGHLFTWAEPPQITLWRAGEIVQQRSAALALRAGACAADGKTYALASATGRLWLLGEDLRTRWESQLPGGAVALALDPLGELLAASDDKGGLHLLQARTGKGIWRAESPRPLRHLAFVPEAPLLIGAADTGVVLAFDPRGKCLWRQGVAANLGSLAVSGDGKLIALAGYGEGPCCFDPTGHRQAHLRKLGACRRLALSFDGRMVVTEDLDGVLHLATSGCVKLEAYTPQGRVLDLALSPLGDTLAVAFQSGGLVEMHFGGERE